MLRTVGARHAGLDDAGVLEEAEVPPAQFLPVVRLAQPAAAWAREAGAGVGGDGQMQLVRLTIGLQPLVDHPPGWGQAKAEGEDVAVCHGGSPRNQGVPAQGRHRMPRQYAIGLRDAAARPVCLKTGAVLAAVKNAARRYAVACGHS